MKELTVGSDYSGVFGLDGATKKMIFLGGSKWRAVNGDRTSEMDSEKTTQAAIEYINRPTTTMGSPS